MGLPSSETATMPASFMAAISAMASPLLPTLAAPMGQTRTPAAVLARSRMKRVTLALSLTGLRVGHAADGGESAACCGARAGLDGFGRFLAGLAEMRVKINEARRDD